MATTDQQTRPARETQSLRRPLPPDRPLPELLMEALSGENWRRRVQGAWLDAYDLTPEEAER